MKKNQNELLAAIRRRFISLLALASLATLLPVGWSSKESVTGTPSDEPLNYRSILEISEMILSMKFSTVGQNQ